MEEEERSSTDSGGAPAWMATFSDMATLLLTFFILLLSFANMDIVKFRDAMGSIQQALGFMPTGTGMFQHTSKPTEFEKPLATSALKNTNYLIQQELQEMVKEHGLERDVEIENTPRGVVLRVRGRIFFSSGTAELKPQAYPILEKIAQIMKRFPSRVSIEGHTDNLPVSGGRYTSNWELSAARAYSALRFLMKKGVDVKRINIAGFADTHPIASNNTEEGRAKNRRVEFVFYEEK
ncbi:MAG TPA: flagellar motor protein MotB [Nitrospirae bacterium]|nr:flagellar motor protein MotB [Nitrospirota bacterium]